MREIVPRNSELVGFVPEDTYKITYDKHKGLAVDMRTAAERDVLPEASYGVKHPEIVLLGGTALNYFGVSAILDTLNDIPDVVQGGTSLAISIGILAQYSRNIRAQHRYNKRKNEIDRKDIYAIAEYDPNVYLLPKTELRFDIDAGEPIDDLSSALLRTPQGRKLLATMDVEIDDSRGLRDKKHALRMQLESLIYQYMDADTADNQHPEAKAYRKQKNAEIRELQAKLRGFDYDHKYGKDFGGDVSMTVRFSPAEAVHAIVKRAVNKSQLLFDASAELQEVTSLMQRQAVLRNALSQIPYRDLDLHKKTVSEVEDQIKALNLQILAIVAAIKQIALSQQDTILSGYADGIL